MAKQRKPDDAVSKKTLLSRAREQKIKDMLKENEQVLGKKAIEKNFKEAEKILIARDDENLLNMNDKDIEAMIDDYEQQYQKNRDTYVQRQKMIDEEFFKSHAGLPEAIECYMLAKKITRSSKAAKELVENNTKEQLEKKYKEYRKKENLRKSKSKKNVEKEKEHTQL